MTEVVNLMRNSFSTIDFKKKEMNCNNVKIKHSNYVRNSLFLEIYSPMMNISKINILIDDNEEFKSFNVEKVYTGESKTLIIQNLTINRKYKIYAEDCEENVFENEI